METSEIVVEKGIDIPKRVRYGIWRDTANRMEHGDSVHLNTLTSAKKMYLAIRIQSKNTAKGVIRKTDTGYRVWKVNKPE